MKYDYYKQETISDFSQTKVNSMYNKGFVMTRLQKGTMNQVRSLRINLKAFELTSENRRILRKMNTLGLQLHTRKLPIVDEQYNWQIHKIGKDFYSQKYGEGTFSAGKIKQILTTDHNFNLLFEYKTPIDKEEIAIGYCICVATQEFLHYCFPFYRLDIEHKNIGMGMMLHAILWAKEKGMSYVYLGSLPKDKENDPSYSYKLQFKGLELWNHKEYKWSSLAT
jgi:arginyl-tRNA--protein-N-Asp/Glu arginylyltransferase